MRTRAGEESYRREGGIVAFSRTEMVTTATGRDARDERYYGCSARISIPMRSSVIVSWNSIGYDGLEAFGQA